MSTTYKKKLKVEPKSVIIDGVVHQNFKKFCRGKGLKMGRKIEDLIRIYLDNYTTIEPMIHDYYEKKANEE